MRETNIRRPWRQRIKLLLTRFVPNFRSRLIPGLPGRVHRYDAMLYDDSEESVINYLKAADSAMENLAAALAAADRDFADVTSCLDFGCGHGRIQRFLQQRIPAHRITACDVDEEAVWFCAAELGARPLVSSWNLAELRLGTYDLIWSGSVLTHLDRADGELLLTHFARSLNPGGVLVFSAHGQTSLNGLGWLYEGAYATEAETIRREVAEAGFSFRPYGPEYGEHPSAYGMSWHAKDMVFGWFEEHFGDSIEPLFHRPKGWDNHHDVYSFRRMQ